jgi:hypothetical protein
MRGEGGNGDRKIGEEGDRGRVWEFERFGERAG